MGPETARPSTLAQYITLMPLLSSPFPFRQSNTQSPAVVRLAFRLKHVTPPPPQRCPWTAQSRQFLTEPLSQSALECVELAIETITLISLRLVTTESLRNLIDGEERKV